MLLQSLLDKGALGPRRAAFLRQLAGGATSEGALPLAVGAACPRGWDPRAVVEAVAAGRWDALAAFAAALARRCHRRHIGAVTYGLLARRLSWLRHVACNVEQSKEYARNPIWLRGNVEAVLRSIRARGADS